MKCRTKPTGGSFTTATVARRLGRRCVSCDISEAYVRDGVERVRREIAK